MLKVGIVGLPNVGKSTLFNALLKKQVALAANYPFATIEPNVGVVAVPDERLEVLSKISNSSKIVPANVEFYDIAGLVEGASEGAGLGNKFLSHIRECAVIVQVVREFVDSNINHVLSSVDSKRDQEIINSELILADLQTLGKQKEPRGNAEKEEKLRFETSQKLSAKLNLGIAARDVQLTLEELEAILSLNLLTLKPMIYVINTSEESIANESAPEFVGNSFFVRMSAKTESELVDFAPHEAREFLQSLGQNESSLDKLIRLAYKSLGLISFLTTGELETRAWTIPVGTNAQNASGAIHGDFVKKFIKAEIIKYTDFVECLGWSGAREKGKILLAGRDYIMQEGDIVEFKIGQ